MVEAAALPGTPNHTVRNEFVSSTTHVFFFFFPLPVTERFSPETSLVQIR